MAPVLKAVETAGEAAWGEINRQVAKAGLTELVEQLRGVPSPVETLNWFDGWWVSTRLSDQQRRVMLLVVWGGTLIFQTPP